VRGRRRGDHDLAPHKSVLRINQAVRRRRLQTRSYDDKEGVKRYVTEVVAENLVLLGGTASSNSNGNGGGGRERSARRPAPGKPSNGHRDRTPEPAEQGLEDDGVPF
jgi:single-strand DNA-binding protein